MGVSIAEKLYQQEGIAQDLRSDGRGRLDFRSFSIQTDVIPQANGSARVRLGNTDVIASVKAELGSPRPSQPRCGSIDIFVECSPTASPEFEGRGGDDLSMELSRALQRSFVGGSSGSGAAVDLISLGIVEGKVCWDLYVDAIVLNSDGNILDAFAIAIKAALSNTGLPRVQVTGGSEDIPEVELSDNPEEFARLDATHVPITITLTKIGKRYIVDATAEEESQMSSALSVSVNRKGMICGLTKQGITGLDPSVVSDMIAVAKQLSHGLLARVDTEIVASERRA